MYGGQDANDWILAIIRRINKGKVSSVICLTYGGISLLSMPGKMYGRTIIEKMNEITRWRIGKEQ